MQKTVKTGKIAIYTMRQAYILGLRPRLLTPFMGQIPCLRPQININVGTLTSVTKLWPL